MLRPKNYLSWVYVREKVSREESHILFLWDIKTKKSKKIFTTEFPHQIDKFYFINEEYLLCPSLRGISTIRLRGPEDQKIVKLHSFDEIVIDGPIAISPSVQGQDRKSTRLNSSH